MRFWLAVPVFVRRFVVALTIVSLAGAGVLVFGERAGKSEFAKRKVVQIDDGVLAPSKPTQPANYLLIGHDADGNSDTMMVVHVDPADPTPLLVSFPRDLIVDIPGHGRGQLNGAIGIGGPSLFIATFKSYFNVPINHFIQVDFASFPRDRQRHRQSEGVVPDARTRSVHRARTSSTPGAWRSTARRRWRTRVASLLRPR